MLYKIRHLIWLAARSAGSVTRLDNVIYLFFKFYCPATGAAPICEQKRINLSLWRKLNWHNAITQERWLFAKEKVVQNWFVFWQNTQRRCQANVINFVACTLLFFPGEIIFRVGTILSANGIKPVVLPRYRADRSIWLKRGFRFATIIDLFWNFNESTCFRCDWFNFPL